MKKASNNITFDDTLSQIKEKAYYPCDLEIVDFILETESKEYNACRFKLNSKGIISRKAKITPKKVGQFVTFWKRNKMKVIEPFNEKDLFDYFVVNVKRNNELGQFVFPKAILIKKGVISTYKKEGKRAFRVYPRWDIATNKQAKKTQKWQLAYFYEMNKTIDYTRVKALYSKE